ncbi:MAG: 30S ribosomal protein S13 [Candidatus Micrarchaeota archaeon]
MEKDNKSKDVKPSKDHNKSDKKKPASAPSQQMSVRKMRKPTSKDFYGVIRLVDRDLDGHYKVSEALRQVKGIGHSLSNALIAVIKRELSISPDVLVGDLTEDQLGKVEEIIKNPAGYGVPLFLLNRQKDYDTGTDRHLLGTDLIFQTKQDIQREKETRSWIGWRHSLGQKVRGQHNRTTGRSGMTMGVVRKALAPASAPAKAEAKK